MGGDHRCVMETFTISTLGHDEGWSMMNNSVEMANEACGSRRGRPGQHTVNVQVGHFGFRNDHVEHDMNDGTDEKTRTMRNITYANGEQIDIVTENENRSGCRRN